MSKKVQRGLSLTSPAPKGKDVERLQEAVNGLYKHFKIDRRIAADGEYGTQTHSAVRQLAFVLGAGPNNRKALKKGRVTKDCQRLIRGRKKRKLEIVRARARARFRKKLRARYKADAGQVAINRAAKYVGTTEQPDGSNWGGNVEKFIRFTGYTGPVYWCGCWACWVVVKLGGAKIPSKIRLGYGPYIISDARNHDNGLEAVAFGDARPGDIIVLWGGEHIEVVSGRPVGGSLPTIGGNTSPQPGSGSESNGGGVYRRIRSRADVTVVARPNYS